MPGHCTITTLCCGYNGTGYSSMLSVESTSVSGETMVLNRCLANVGDGTVRFCKENKIKLSSISCIIISSLAPHNISGFAGVFLSLSDMGAGKLSVIGPPGLKSYLDLMTPFINRKYPELHVVEIDLDTPQADLCLSIDHFQLRFLPLCSEQSATRVIAIAASVSPRWSSNGVAELQRQCLILPVSYYFQLSTSYCDMIQWGLSSSSSSSIENGSLAVFVPLAVGSFERSASLVLQEVCSLAKVCGVLYSGRLSSEMCEFRYCQSSLSLLNTVCKPLFPGVLHGLQSDVDMFGGLSSAAGLSHGAVSSSGIPRDRLQSTVDYEPLPLFPGASLLSAVPLLTFSAPLGGSALPFVVQQPLSRNKQLVDRCSTLKALYDAKVQPNLEAILAGTYVRAEALLLGSNSGSAKMDVDRSGSEETPEVVSLSNHSAASQLRLLIKSNKRKLSSRNLAELESHRPPEPPRGYSLLPPPAPFDASPLQMDAFHSTNGSLSLSVDTVALQHLEIDSAAPSPFNGSNTTLGSARNYSGSGFDYAESEYTDVYSVRSGSSTTLTSPSESMGGLLTPATSSSLYFSSPIRSIQAEEKQKKHPRHFFEEEPPRETLLPSAHHFMSDNNVPPPNPMQDLFRLTFFGTGCATPSKHRNNSSILLALRSTPKVSILLDVGESTAAQMFQSVCGDVARYDALLLSIKVIWISHHHADHIVGLPQIIEQIHRAHLRAAAGQSRAASDAEPAGGGRVFRSKYDTVSQYQKVCQYTDSSKIMLVASEGIMKYFEYSLAVAGLDDLVTFYPIASTLYAGTTADVALATNGVVTRLRSTPVHHCHSSYGVVLDFASKHKLVYSGDCRPSQSLVKAGMDCDLLIHEATFDDSLAADAAKKKHSTSSEARSIAVQMRARSTILTHFSQRYPVMLGAANGSSTAAGVASVGGDLLTSQPSGCGGWPAMNCSVSFDFLNFSFPSQVRSLPKACNDVVKILSAIEAEKEALREAGQRY